jgi:hypothetical protein
VAHSSIQADDTPDLFAGIDTILNDTRITHNSKADLVRCLKRIAPWLLENEMAAPGLKVEKVRKISPLLK